MQLKKRRIQMTNMRNETKKKRNLEIVFKGKKYSFSIRALIMFPIGSIILAVLMIRFLEMRENFWWQEITTKHAVFILNLCFNVGAEALFLPQYYFPWHIDIPGSVRTYINHGCTYITSISIFIAIIICTPHSQDPRTKEDIIWRKLKDIIFTLTIIYIFNIFRIAIQNYLYHIGFAWKLIHDSLAVLSIIVAVHIFTFLLCNNYIPEWYISIYYSAKLIYNGIRAKPDSQKTYPKIIFK